MAYTVAVGVTCSGGGSCIHNVGSVLCIMLSKPESVFLDQKHVRHACCYLSS